MTTLAQFVAANNGKRLDFDGVYGAQCVDLIDYYVTQVLGIPVAWANAIDWFGKDNAYLDWTRNTPTNMPLPGDIIVWGANFKAGTGQFGHIAIAVDQIRVMSFRSFDQNYPTNSPCHLQTHTYDGVIGWGRLKGKPPSPTPSPSPVPGEVAGTDEAPDYENLLTRFLNWLARILGFREY